MHNLINAQYYANLERLQMKQPLRGLQVLAIRNIKEKILLCLILWNTRSDDNFGTIKKKIVFHLLLILDEESLRKASPY